MIAAMVAGADDVPAYNGAGRAWAVRRPWFRSTFKAGRDGALDIGSALASSSLLPGSQ
ncbi:hypothetical protein [Sphingomonas aerophila]|uniref:Uncharacterized protein n=1 Tax=Sphingomonas aerophila TaxID=1344948 RepID=A0A7W9BD01_9SPHN|nr:hypothetical protein [Sphingomonas aerophila]MBB5714733.1 hypothetical protein [Sphingomonas aerophila]